MRRYRIHTPAPDTRPLIGEEILFKEIWDRASTPLFTTSHAPCALRWGSWGFDVFDAERGQWLSIQAGPSCRIPNNHPSRALG